MTVLFISDLHLSPSHPDITDCFYRFLNDEAPLASALYILGDLFEVWVGDDDDVPLHHEVAAALKVLSDKGVAIYFIHGNRDFMIGKRFAKASGMTLLPEHTVIDLFGKPTLILHGDTLCIQDEGYQRYRKKVHNPFAQWLFMRLPLSYRKNIGSKIRKGSTESNQQKAEDIMDVDHDEVSRVMASENVMTMIHGHTHRPDIHTFSIGNDLAQRIVLGDWYTQGSVLACTKDGCKLETRSF
ncbi:UDP-2,3-diacylglucosamine diphosphatase [Enterovibrio norvegicus]|uniref:UDP-2,3-diacylglucosamine diphosphatase n=1 Tax=Enterovibrio norvegicus TaxID=188144 RepID=UPI000C85753E|nr:UDP-2,3-diacylglucosamine diphosphatase [Enterovibrio norvegicus]PML81001.1 UDP-2,3-diacylglucosamine diphosphatase [Enterovibrio norvegicus]